MDRANDRVRLVGELAGRPELSHIARDGEYWKFPLAVRRLSGTEDVLNILATREQLSALTVTDAPRILIEGEARSWNNRTGEGPRLVITVLAREIRFTDEEFDNRVEITGALCKKPVLRRTPMGREICDMMLAVGRPYGRSDYLPCIAWGSSARLAATKRTGDTVAIAGRLQSRAYIKLEGDEPVEKVAYEISAMQIRLAPVEKG